MRKREKDRERVRKGEKERERERERERKDWSCDLEDPTSTSLVKLFFFNIKKFFPEMIPTTLASTSVSTSTLKKRGGGGIHKNFLRQTYDHFKDGLKAAIFRLVSRGS